MDDFMPPLDIIAYQPSRTCTSCGKRKVLDQFPYQHRDGRGSYRRVCTDCRNALRRSKWAEVAPEQKRAIGHRAKGRDLTPEQFAAKVAAQAGRCLICGVVPAERPVGRPRLDGTRAMNQSLVYDHDHASGAGRGLLCHPCNLILGNAVL